MGMYDREWYRERCAPPANVAFLSVENAQIARTAGTDASYVVHKKSQLLVHAGETSASESSLDFDSILRKIEERGIEALTDLEREWLIRNSLEQRRKNAARS